MSFKEIIQTICAIPFFTVGWITGIVYRIVTFCWQALQVGFIKAQGINLSEHTTRY